MLLSIVSQPQTAVLRGTLKHEWVTLFLVRLSQRKYLRTYRDDMATRNLEDIHFSLRILTRDLSVAEAPKTAPHNAAHLYIATRHSR